MASHEITYTLRDRLGSVVTLTNHNNLIMEHRSYDPFGKPRYGTMQASPSATLFNVANGTPFTMRGFTDHEHIDEAQLIHMNGRVYDYNLGRFLSVDPFIQEPGNSQSLNPYSYIMNNPLGGTDPSGYVSVGNLGLGETKHCDFKCMVGYQGFTEAGSNGANFKSQASSKKEMAGGKFNFSELNSQSDITSYSVDDASKAHEVDNDDEANQEPIDAGSMLNHVASGLKKAHEVVWEEVKKGVSGAFDEANELRELIAVINMAEAKEHPDQAGPIFLINGEAREANASMQVTRSGYELTFYRGYYQKDTSGQIETVLHEVIHGTKSNIAIKNNSKLDLDYDARAHERDARTRATDLYRRYADYIHNAINQNSNN